MFTAFDMKIGSRRHIYIANVEETFVGIVGVLSADPDLRVWAAFGSAELSENDE